MIVKAVKSTKTVPVLDALMELTGYFGLPRRIVSDRGTAFTAKSLTAYCDANGIQHTKTAVRTPRANGQVERANQSILAYLRSTTTNPKDWDLHLREFQFAINSQVNVTSGFRPNELIFDFKLLNVVRNRLVAAVHADTNDTITAIDMTARRNQAAENMSRERQRWKRQFDQRHSQPKQYVVGDLVLIENGLVATGESRKLDMKWKGPYTVRKCLDKDRHVIGDIEGAPVTGRKFDSVYTAAKIKPWCQSPPELDETDEDDITGGTEAIEWKDVNQATCDEDLT